MLHSATPDNELIHELEAADQTAKQRDLSSIRLGQIYTEGIQSEFYQHLKASVVRRIELLDAARDHMTDDSKFSEWRAITNEIRTLRRWLALPAAIIQRAANADAQLQDKSRRDALLKEKR